MHICAEHRGGEKREGMVPSSNPGASLIHCMRLNQVIKHSELQCSQVAREQTTCTFQYSRKIHMQCIHKGSSKCLLSTSLICAVFAVVTIHVMFTENTPISLRGNYFPFSHSGNSSFSH